MTWQRGVMTEYPGAKKRDAILVTCDHDECPVFEILGNHEPEKVVRLLERRGWDSATDDLCPTHRRADS